MSGKKQKLALVVGSLPTIEEIDQFQLLSEIYDLRVIASESICTFISENSFFQDLTCIVLKDHDENPTFLPGLEQILGVFDIVVLKERLGLYSYQTLKAKWRHGFRLLVWVDNLAVFPAQDVDQMRTIRVEVTNAADGFLVQSKAAAKNLEVEGVEAERIFHFNPWVESRTNRSASAKAQARKRLGFSESDYVITYFGQIEWEEGLTQLAVAVKMLIDQKPSYKDKLKIAFCGIGSFAPELKELFSSLDITECSVYFAPSRDAHIALLNATDAMYIASQPSRDRVEGDPYRIVNAMVNGIPLIASRTPLVEDYCGKHRFDFCASSPASLAKAMLKVKTAPNLANNIVQKNQAESKKRFDRKAVKSKMMDIFETIVSKKIKVDKSSLDHRVLEVEAKMKSGQYTDAIDIIESIFQCDSIPLHHQANLYRLIADCFVKLGDFEGAKDAYSRGVEIDPYAPKIYIGLGTVALIKGISDVAVLHFQKAISLAPEDEMANLGLGLAFQGMTEHKEAMRWINKALRINPENSAAIFSLVKSSHELNEYQQVEQVLKQYLSKHPESLDFIYTLGGIYFKQSRFQETVSLMQDILTKDPANERALSLKKQSESEQANFGVTTSNG
jgi:tetratricopeptide (TPR) repeat protein